MQVKQMHDEKVFSSVYSQFLHPLPTADEDNLIAIIRMSELDLKDDLL